MSGWLARMARVAASPFVPGMAQSITTTRGFEARGQADRLVAVAGLADHDDVGVVFEQAAKAAPHEGVVVGEEDGDLVRHV